MFGKRVLEGTWEASRLKSHWKQENTEFQLVPWGSVQLGLGKVKGWRTQAL